MVRPMTPQPRTTIRVGSLLAGMLVGLDLVVSHEPAHPGCHHQPNIRVHSS